MKLAPHDLHLILDPSARKLTLWDVNHRCLMTCETRNRAVNEGSYGHDGNCPPGEYILGRPIEKSKIPFGFWFIPIRDYPGHNEMAKHGRAGIGIHGGGSGLVHPFAPRQGWQVTHGCWRLQNVDLAALVLAVHNPVVLGGTVYVTVNEPVPGDVDEGGDDWAPVVELAEGE